MSDGTAVEMSYSIPAGGAAATLMKDAMESLNQTGTADIIIWNDERADAIRLVVPTGIRGTADRVMAGLGCTKV